MFLVYSPAEGDVQRWRYDPNRLMSPEMEAIERITDRSFRQFTADVQEGSALCRRALLWVFLKRAHPGIKFPDVSFAWDELSLQYSRQEYGVMLRDVRERMAGDQLAAAVAHLEKEQETSFDEDDAEEASPDTGKAS